MSAVGQAKIDELVKEARKTYDFRRRKKEQVLVRRRKSNKEVDRLVGGRWIRQRFLKFDNGSKWKTISNQKLGWHLRRYMVEGLADDRLGWGLGELKERVRRSWIGRKWNPPLRGGATREVSSTLAKRSRLAYKQSFNGISGTSLTELAEQASHGFENQRERSAAVEQRANFFLGAAGLTTSLVLANAGLLLGTSKLDSPWLYLGAGALLVASLFAIAAGFRAVQATMYTFIRTPAYEVERVLERRVLGVAEGRRWETAALLVAQARTKTIADWKVSRLIEARKWFMWLILAVAALTGMVLGNAIERGVVEDSNPPAKPAKPASP